MATITLLKKGDGVYTYSDFVGAKAALRLSELNASSSNYLTVRRRKDTNVEAYLVKASYYEERVAALVADQSAVFGSNVVKVTDDFLSGNMVRMISLVLGDPDVASHAAKYADEGLGPKAFLAYEILSTADDTKDPNALVRDTDLVIPSLSKAYLLHPAHYNSLVAGGSTGLAGVGNGTISVVQYPGVAFAETLTITCTATAANGGTFSVVGSTSGSLGSATVGVKFVSDYFELVISDGSIDFNSGDVFTVSLAAAY